MIYELDIPDLEEKGAKYNSHGDRMSREKRQNGADGGQNELYSPIGQRSIQTNRVDTRIVIMTLT